MDDLGREQGGWVHFGGEGGLLAVLFNAYFLNVNVLSFFKNCHKKIKQ